MKSNAIKKLASALVFVLPALAGAQGGSLADRFFSGDYSGIAETEVRAVPGPAPSAGQFVFDAEVNKQIAARLNIPVFFALPGSAYSRTASGAAAEGMWEFRHPASANAAAPVGLRVYLTPHKNVAARLAATGLVQTGDIILSFRPEWGFQGPYPNIQMGVSHAGLAYVENGVVSNIDNPLTAEYMGKIDSEHYSGTAALHIVRPRNLSAAQKNNILGWSKKIAKAAPAIYPSQLSFNKDYFSPKYTADMKFVKTLAQIVMQQDKTSQIDLYCSEFVWAMLSLKDCDPAHPEVFSPAGVPACVKPAFNPLPMLGDYFQAPKSPMARLGLSDGPLAVINSMGLPENEKQRYISQVFAAPRQMSPGHAAVAATLAPYFGQLEGYYTGIQKGTPQAIGIMNSFNGNVKPNYSPTSYIVNALLPDDSKERVMDVVGTVVFSD